MSCCVTSTDLSNFCLLVAKPGICSWFLVDRTIAVPSRGGRLWPSLVVGVETALRGGWLYWLVTPHW